jgi:hypothetical protein
MRTVISLTTLPDRYDDLYHTLKSLHDQIIKADCIYLTLPAIAKRSGKPYPPLPKKIKQLCTVVEIEKDYGPVCKLYGALIKEQDPDTAIITVDDDVLYPPDFIKIMLEKSKIKPNGAITGAGVLLHNGYMSINTNFKGLMFMNGFLCGFPMNDYRKVDIIQGISGVLYKRKFFPYDHLYDQFLKYTEDEDIFKSDDILTSSYLCSRGIKRYTFKGMPLVSIKLASDDALSANLPKMLKVFNNAVDKCKKLGLLNKIEKSSILYSPYFKFNFWVIVVVFIFIVWLLYMLEIDY